MQLIDVLNKLRAIENPTEEVKEAIEQTEAMTHARPIDPDSVFARLGNDIQSIMNDALDGNDMAEEITNELGDYLRNGDAPAGSHYEKAILTVMDALNDGPAEQAEAAELAISILHSEETNPKFADELPEADEDMIAPDMAVVVEPEPEVAPAVEPDMQNKDEAVDMAHGQLEFIKYAAQEIEDYLMRGMPLPEWMQNKLSRMHGNIMNLHAYIEGEEGKAGLNESIELEEGQYDSKSREELLKMKAQAEADIKNMQSSGDGPQQKFYDETQMMMAQQHLDDINNALKKVGEGVNEASGEFAEPFYDMLDQYSGGEQIPQPWKTIIDQFVMDLDANEVEEFVDRFRSQYMDESFESVEEEAVEETVQVPVSELQDLLRLAGVDASIEEWANTPMGSEEEPIYGDAEEQVIGLAGGLNGPKNQYNKANAGDNAMAVKESLADKWNSIKEQSNDQGTAE